METPVNLIALSRQIAYDLLREHYDEIQAANPDTTLDRLLSDLRLWLIDFYETAQLKARPAHKVFRLARMWAEEYYIDCFQVRCHTIEDEVAWLFSLSRALLRMRGHFQTTGPMEQAHRDRISTVLAEDPTTRFLL